MSTSAKPLPMISIVVPAYNEQNNVWPCYHAVSASMESLKGRYRYEIIFLDNHSTDETFAELSKISAQDKRVRVARYNRNYGFNKSLMTAFHLASGACIVPLDCDLQDPPDMIIEFVAQWEKGHDLVIGVRTKREEGALFTNSRKLFYRLLKHITEDTVVVDAGDFYLADKSVLDRVRRLYDANPYVRALVSSMAVNIAEVQYTRRPRQNDKSKFPFRKLLGLAVTGIVNHSTLPLRFASIFGLVASFATAVMAGLFLFGRLFLNVSWPAGYASEIILILFGISLNALFLGIIGEYLCKIYQQLHRRPLTVIESAINLSPTTSSITEY